MQSYVCPCCAHSTVMWDPRTKRFVCHNRHCGVAFPAPELGMTSAEMRAALMCDSSLVSQSWFNELKTTDYIIPDRNRVFAF